MLAVVSDQPVSNPQGYVEVWLINTDGKRMISLGQFRGGGQASYVIDTSAWDEGFAIVDLLRERYDGQVAHSGDSMMRGQLV